jgi:hypothetical protein
VSYARFSSDSDVYVYLADTLQCCGCALSSQSRSFATTAALLEHLDEHKQAGHAVPPGAVHDLLADAEVNDEFIRTGDDRLLDEP